MNIKWTIMAIPVLILKLQDRCYGITVYWCRTLTVVISYKVIRGTNKILTRYYENWDFTVFLHFKTFGTRPNILSIMLHA